MSPPRPPSLLTLSACLAISVQGASSELPDCLAA